MYELFESTSLRIMQAKTVDEMHQVIRDYNAAAPFMATVETLEDAPRSMRYPKRLRVRYLAALYKALRRWQLAEQYRLP